jgi:hypothetical protein
MGPGRRSRAALVAVAAALAWAPLVAAFIEGPFPATTGGFGEPSCQQCHFDNPLNAPGARLGVSGFPRSYTPGRRYAIAVRLERPGLARGGFQLAVRYADGGPAGLQAGRLAAPDNRVKVIEAGDPAVQYAEHTPAGTAATSGSLGWRVTWTAPAGAGGPVVLHVAANAANDDQSALGDFIYLQTLRSQPIVRQLSR